VTGARGEHQNPDAEFFAQPSHYINRELSFIAFNARVLELARDPNIPLLERMRYLCISSSNLDEFFEIRVAGLQKQLQAGLLGTGPDNLSPAAQLEEIRVRTHQLVGDQYKLLNNELLPALEQCDIVFPAPDEWSEPMQQWASQFFEQELLPVLSPLGLAPSHPFPQLTNKSLNFIVSLKGKDAFGREATMAVVRAPRSLPRIIPVPAELSNGRNVFVLLSSMIQQNMALLFAGLKTQGVYQFRVTRNSDLYLADDDVADLRLALQDELNAREYGQAVRLETGADCPPEIIQYLLKEFNLKEQDCYLCHGPVNLDRLQSLPEMIDRPDLKFPPQTFSGPAEHAGGAEIFSELRRRDVLLHYPYQSSASVVSLLRAASTDPNVLAIKQTLYRTGANSEYVEALLAAAHNGKDVTVIIELRARFDEKANITLASKLQHAGVQVVYGVVGIKTHAKLLLIVRREGERLARYAHIGTGNYHTGTARAYTDMNLLTSNEAITVDVQNVFNQLTGLGKVASMNELLHAPFTMHRKVVSQIRKQTRRAKDGQPACIKARMNSLNEPLIIQALYEASHAGVEVLLLVRGICSLRPGVRGLSENIRVFSVLGRFLEHARVYAFGPSGEETVYLSSADWMPRNMFHRVEVAVPVRDKALRDRIVRESLDYYFKDDLFSWELNGNGDYHRREPVGKGFSAQRKLLQQANTNEFITGKRTKPGKKSRK
jgi:polyphosphate kinase